ncbi:MAG: hypothetical protein GYB65_08565 [Chloroflexi bacterium]|nr:hypothetical protein [Chloroflexota bacterium]
MIPIKQIVLLAVCLTIVLLAGCEPLAPSDEPQYIVVTTTNTTGGSTVASTTTADAPPTALTPVDQPLAVVNTPLPSPQPAFTPTLTPTAAPFACDQTQGRVRQETLVSSVTDGLVEYQIYMPPCFGSSLRRYPYVILLPGTGYDETMWTDLGIAEIMDENITNGTLPPMVLVMPDGAMQDDGMWLSEERYNAIADSYEAIITDELIPAVESPSNGLCLWESREGRAIGGISRGGFWAFSIGLRNLTLFHAIGGHSPYFLPDNAPDFANPLVIAEQLDFSTYQPRITMDSGIDDQPDLIANAQAMEEILESKGIPDTFSVAVNGDHSEAYWSAHLLDYLLFYGATWPQDVNALPSCLEPSPRS